LISGGGFAGIAAAKGLSDVRFRRHPKSVRDAP
jgi:hypothetical protein